VAIFKFNCFVSEDKVSGPAVFVTRESPIIEFFYAIVARNGSINSVAE